MAPRSILRFIPGCAALLALAGLLTVLPPAHAQGLAPGDVLDTDAPHPAPAVLPPGVRKLADLAYGRDARQRMDVYLPPAIAQRAGPLPVLFLVHGGAWRLGDKAQPAVVDHKLARWVPRGVVLVSVNYRLLPAAPVAQQLQDVAQALAAVQRQAPAWGADPGRVVLMGHSAGAHLVALLAARPAWAAQQGIRPWRGTVALDSAALRLTALMAQPHLGLYDRAFGSDPAGWAALSPYDQLQAGTPPWLLVCSSTRHGHPCTDAEAMARQVQSLGGQAQVLPQAMSHRAINAELGLDSAYTRAVEAFLATLDPAFARGK